MNRVAVKIENLSVYYGQTPAISGVCLDVKEGEYLGIIGPNGGGKTTLLKAILGIIPINSGKIEIYNEKIGRNRGMIGYVPQFAVMDKRFPISVLEVVLTGRLKQGLSPFLKFSKEDKVKAYRVLERVSMQHLADRQVSELSGGEFQRMLIARALAIDPKILILDEPTASVDVKSREQIYNLLGELNKDMTIILVTHDLLAVASQVNKLVCLNEKLVYHGEPELTEKVVTTLYGCPVDLIAHGVPHRVLKHHEEVEQLD
ncbi:metal ABC transporter ATP-binding protein [Aminipila sp.]|uniref:metal ABC transporter ATP-binding protein n=1 Tax=Aminipila sp. TaxID=2060095 RepID=UPI002897C781|nr:ABC transporter ATP-binding protein [Aminipila sp.]